MLIGIVADDLTGAADSVAPFAKRGYAAEVRFFQHPMQSQCAADALAIDTGSRDSPVKDTLRDLTFRRATRALTDCNPAILFKKIDSMLRGHLRVELDAMRYVLPERLPVICPAFPANGRVVREGRLRINNEPQNRSVRDAFDCEYEVSAQNITLSELRQGADSLSVRLQAIKKSGETRNGGASYIFSDAETDSDLEVIAQAILRHPADYLPVGSAGLSSAFARQFPVVAENTGEIERLLRVFKTGRVLVVIGSLHDVSRNQLRHFSEYAGIAPIIFEVEDGLGALIQRVHQSLNNARRFAIIATPETPLEEFRSMDSLLRWGNLLWERDGFAPFDALFITGGDSAKDAMISLNGNGLEIFDEIQPGVVLGRMTINEGASQIFQDFPVLLKSGGFGTSNLLTMLFGLD